MKQRVSQSKEEVSQENSIRDLASAAAQELDRLASVLRGALLEHPASAEPQAKSRLTAKQIYDARRKADKNAGIKGFSASPAFDTLLDLHINAAAERAVSVSSACIGAACPPSTALRWIHFLEQLGLVRRVPDPRDQRRAFLSLTKEGAIKIEKAIAQYGT